MLFIIGQVTVADARVSTTADCRPPEALAAATSADAMVARVSTTADCRRPDPLAAATSADAMVSTKYNDLII